MTERSNIEFISSDNMMNMHTEVYAKNEKCDDGDLSHTKHSLVMKAGVWDFLHA